MKTVKQLLLIARLIVNGTMYNCNWAVNMDSMHELACWHILSDIPSLPLPAIYGLLACSTAKSCTSRISHKNQPTIALYTFLNSKSLINAVNMSEDCKLLSAGLNNSAVKVWSLTRNKIPRMRDPSELAGVSMADENVMELLMDDKNGAKSLTFYGHNGPVYDVSINHNKSLVLSCGQDCTARLWSLQTHTQLVAYKGHNHPVWACDWSPLGRISHKNQPTIALYTFLNSKSLINAVNMSEDCKLLSAGLNNSAVKVWSLTRNKIPRMRDPSELAGVSMADENVMELLMDDKNGAKSLTFYGHNGPVYDVSINHNKSLVLSCGQDCTARLWSLQTHTQLVAYKGHNHPVWACDWSPLGHYFATGGIDRTVLLWSMQHIAPVRLFAGHLGDITCIKVHPNGNYVASGSSDRSVRIWEIGTGICSRHLTGHKGAVTSLIFSPHGHILASGDETGTILVWDLSTGAHIGTLTNHTGPVTSLAITREGGVIISGGMDSVINTWDLCYVVENVENMTEYNANEDVLINRSRTKESPVLYLATTRKNLIMGVSNYSPKS
eukprot:sb/3463590/